jgi:hypothetical protein
MSFICPSIRESLKRDVGTALRGTRSGTAIVSSTNAPFNFTIHITIPKNVYTKERVDMDALLAFTEYIIRWIASLRWSDTISNLTVRLDLTDAAKEWCWSSTPEITRCNINSGETDIQGWSGRRDIRIWRREDYHKVLIHELLHAFGWDRLVHENSHESREPEALVEAVALLLHCRLLGGKGGYQEILESERKWTACLIQLLQSKRWTTSDTNCREYIIIKGSLILDERSLARFWKWLRLSDAQACRAAWPSLVQASMKSLPNALSKFPPLSPVLSECVPLHLVLHQLSLAPKSP